MSHRGKEYHGEKLGRSCERTCMESLGCQMIPQKWKHIKKRKKRKVVVVVS
jgi:hypothetical protein